MVTVIPSLRLLDRLDPLPSRLTSGAQVSRVGVGATEFSAIWSPPGHVSSLLSENLDGFPRRNSGLRKGTEAEIMMMFSSIDVHSV